jgi:hypothetical protein
MWMSSGSEPSVAVGTITTRWQSFADGLGPLAGPARWVEDKARWAQRWVGDPDPASGLSELSMEIGEAATGQPVRFRTTSPESKITQWVIRGRPGDWWARVTVFRDGVPMPGQLGRT